MTRAGSPGGGAGLDEHADVWQRIRPAVAVLPVAIGVLVGQPHWGPEAALALVLAGALAFRPHRRLAQGTPDAWALPLEVAMAMAVAVMVPLLGSLPAAFEAADVGQAIWRNGWRVVADVLLGLSATAGIMMGYRGLPAVDGALLGLVIMVTMWGNTQSAQGGVNLRAAHRALQEAQEEVREMAALVERERIAQNLHDVLGHSLTVIVLKAELTAAHLGRGDRESAAKANAGVVEVARRSLDEVRRVVQDLPEGEAVGDASALAGELRQAGIEATVTWRPGGTMPPELVRDLALMAREAVTNILRHSGAASASLSLVSREGRRTLEVADDGRGVPPNLLEGRGLKGIRERAERWNGRMAVLPADKGGTRIRVTGEEVAHGDATGASRAGGGPVAGA